MENITPKILMELEQEFLAGEEIITKDIAIQHLKTILYKVEAVLESEDPYVTTIASELTALQQEIKDVIRFRTLNKQLFTIGYAIGYLSNITKKYNHQRHLHKNTPDVAYEDNGEDTESH